MFGTSLLSGFRDDGGKGIGFFEPHGMLVSSRPSPRISNRLGKTDQFFERVQKLIDRAGANGKDVSAVQTALDAFVGVWKDAEPIYASMNGIVNSHQGFDDDVSVTDSEKAREAVREMRAKFSEIRDTLDGSGRALRDAIKAFREAKTLTAKYTKAKSLTAKRFLLCALCVLRGKSIHTNSQSAVESPH